MLDEAPAPMVAQRSRDNRPAQCATTTKTTCPYCGVGCGVLATPDGAGGARVAGDPNHPANFGRLCSKGSALDETLALEGRLLHPMMRGAEGGLRRASWDEALDRVAREFARIIARDGPNAVAIYLSGQLLTEDYYVANKLMKGFIGSSNVDTNSRLCMASTVAGQRRAFGFDTVPGCYEDLDRADLIVLVGSNAAWCHPILYQRMLRNKRERGAKIVVIDPRKTATSEEADLFLGIAPGMDQALFCGLLAHLARSGALDQDFILRHTAGFDETLASARALAPSIAATAAVTGLREFDIAVFFEMFAATPHTVTCFSQGVNQSAQGTDKVNAIINCHLATGRIGKPGASPFSLTGQPNAMGGREVGGLANQLAAHMGFEPESVERVRRFWNAPRMAPREGHKAVQMFGAAARGDIKALWVIGTNPAASLPDADMARAALENLELFVVSDNVLSNDTINARPHVLLPAQAWGEKDGTVTNSERRISRQRAFMPVPGEARADWLIFSQVGERMAFSGFEFSQAADVFREHAALSAFENDGSRDFDLGGLAGLTNEGYDALEPTQWPIRAGESKGRARLFSDGGFFTLDRRARFVAPEPPALKTKTSTLYPLRLNTGRVRDQWHTMTRTGSSPRLARHSPEPFIEVNGADAQLFGLTDGGFARVSTQWGACVLRVIVTDRQPRGQVFAPIHWTATTSSNARIGALVAPFTDPISGQPEAKATPAALASCAFSSNGFLLSRRTMVPPEDGWWARAAIPGGWAYKIASNLAPSSWRAFLTDSFLSGDVVEYVDDARGIFRAAVFDGDRLECVLFIGSDPAPDWEATLQVFQLDAITASQRASLLSGFSRDGAADRGPVICACFGVGANAIAAAIAGGCASPAAIGEKLRAGTNCGSCIPEIKRLIAAGAAAVSNG